MFADNFSSVLVVAAHPDDEVLGCGGTIAKLTKSGIHVHVIFLADGITSRDTTTAIELKHRQAATSKAMICLGIQSVEFSNLADNCLDTVGLLEIVKIIEKFILKYQPQVIFTHHAGDLNIDHQRVHQAVATACRPQQGHSVKTLLFFEIPSSTEWQIPGSSSVFNPNWFVDISSTLETKLKALEAYADELRPWPHPRSLLGVKALAYWRGATVGVEAAESFMLGRKIQ